MCIPVHRQSQAKANTLAAKNNLRLGGRLSNFRFAADGVTFSINSDGVNTSEDIFVPCANEQEYSNLMPVFLAEYRHYSYSTRIRRNIM